MSDQPLDGRRILMPVADRYEDLELWYPRIRMKEAGAEVVVAGVEAGKTHHGKHGYPCVAEHALADLDAGDFDGVIVAGGMQPDELRTVEPLLEILRAMHADEKCIAFICHAGWVPISAGILEGANVTGWSSIRDDLVNAGARFLDREVVVDGPFVSSRNPDDLPAFCRAIIAHLSAGAS